MAPKERPEAPSLPELTLDILIPTRGRPKRMGAVMRNVLERSARPDLITFAWYIDNDDKASWRKAEELDGAKWLKPFREVIFVVGVRTCLPAAYNELKAYTNGDLIMYLGDDVEFRTDWWDDAARRAFLRHKDRVLLAWPRDPAREPERQFPDHGVISRWAANALRYVFPCFPPHPKIPGATGVAFGDIWLHAVYSKLNRLKLLEDVELAHLHWHGDVSPTWQEQGEGSPPEIDVGYAIHGILNKHRKTREQDMRIAEIPQHCEILRRWIRFVERGGLERAAKELGDDELAAWCKAADEHRAG